MSTRTFPPTPARRSGAPLNLTARSILLVGVGVTAFLLLGSYPCRAAQSERVREDSTESGLSAYKVIAEKNIFNPKRYARSANSRSNKESSRAVKSESLVLTGTMDYEKGRFAFFEGSSSSFKKVVERSGKVADLQVLRIEPDGVLLDSGTNELRLKVGDQLRRQEGGLWKPAGRAELASSSRSFAPTPPPRQSDTQTSAPEQSGAAELISRYLEGALGDGPPMPPGVPGQPFQPPSAPPGTPAQPQVQGAVPQPGDASSASVQPSGTAAPAAPAQSSDEVLRRLMERREQEMNQ